MRKPNSSTTDRERILAHLLNESRFTQLLGGIMDGEVRKPQWRSAKPGEPIEGQLVMGVTSGFRADAFTVSWCVGRGDPGPDYVEHDIPKLRAIGQEHWIWFFNESFDIYNGDLDNPIFLEGWRREFHDKVLRAMPKAGDAWRYQFGGLKLNCDSAALTVRPHIWFSKEVHGDKGDEPFTIQIPMSPTVLQRDIVAAMKSGGFGTKWNKTP